MKTRKLLLKFLIIVSFFIIDSGYLLAQSDMNSLQDFNYLQTTGELHKLYLDSGSIEKKIIIQSSFGFTSSKSKYYHTDVFGSTGQLKLLLRTFNIGNIKFSCGFDLGFYNSLIYTHPDSGFSSRLKQKYIGGSLMIDYFNIKEWNPFIIYLTIGVNQLNLPTVEHNVYPGFYQPGDYSCAFIKIGADFFFRIYKKFGAGFGVNIHQLFNPPTGVADTFTNGVLILGFAF